MADTTSDHDAAIEKLVEIIMKPTEQVGVMFAGVLDEIVAQQATLFEALRIIKDVLSSQNVELESITTRIGGLEGRIQQLEQGSEGGSF